MIGTDDLRDHQARCVPHVAILHMLAGDRAGLPLPPDAIERVAEAISAILVEAKAAGHAALAAADSRRSANLELLAARQARLAHAAEDALDSARRWFSLFYVQPYWWMLRRAPWLWRRLFELRQQRRHRSTAPAWVFRRGCRPLRAV